MGSNRTKNKWYFWFAIILLGLNSQKIHAFDSEILPALLGLSHYERSKVIYKNTYGNLCPKFSLKEKNDCGYLETSVWQTLILYLPKSDFKSQHDESCTYKGVFSNKEFTYVGEMTPNKVTSNCYEISQVNVKFHGIGAVYSPEGKKIQSGRYIDNRFEGEIKKGTETAKRFNQLLNETPKVGPRKEFTDPNQHGPRLRNPSVKTSPNKKTNPDTNKIVTASTGSGFAVSSDGHLITNHHVINGCQEVYVHVNGNGIPAQILLADKRNDLALLKAEFRPDHSFPLSKDGPELMEDIFVAGYPFGKNFSASITVTKGIVSRLSGLQNNLAQMQIDAALQSGNSGGPIVDQMGNVVGVAVSKLDYKGTLKKFGSIPENINFGIKANMVDSLLRNIGVKRSKANDKRISNTELGKQIQKGTFYIACRMTMAQINRMKTEKVMFSDFD